MCVYAHLDLHAFEKLKNKKIKHLKRFLFFFKENTFVLNDFACIMKMLS